MLKRIQSIAKQMNSMTRGLLLGSSRYLSRVRTSHLSVVNI
jgi:hypothetical protein